MGCWLHRTCPHANISFFCFFLFGLLYDLEEHEHQKKLRSSVRFNLVQLTLENADIFRSVRCLCHLSSLHDGIRRRTREESRPWFQNPAPTPLHTRSKFHTSGLCSSARVASHSSPLSSSIGSSSSRAGACSSSAPSGTCSSAPCS